MKKIITNIFILLIYLLSEQFFDLVAFKYEENDIILVVSLLFVFINLKTFLVFAKRHFNIIAFLFLLFVINFFTSSINYSQPILYSFKTGRYLITYILIAFVAYAFVKYNKNNNDYIPLFIPIIIIALNYYAYFTQDFKIFNENFKVTERFNDVRFMVAGTSVIYLVLYYSNRIQKKLINGIILLLLLSIIIVIAKTRGIIFPILLTILFSKNINSLLRLQKSTLYVAAGLIATFFIFGNTIINFLNEAFYSTVKELQSSQNNNIQIRFTGYIYYWNILKDSAISVLLGNGIPSEFTMNKFEENLYLSDIGALKIIFTHGILGLLVILKMIVNALKVNVLENKIQGIRYDVKLFALFQLFSLLSLTFFFKTPAVLFFFIIYMQSSYLRNESRRINH